MDLFIKTNGLKIDSSMLIEVNSRGRNSILDELR